MREFVCSYASCQKTAPQIMVKLSDERPRFCCESHAASYLVRIAHMRAFGTTDEMKWNALDRSVRDIVGDGSAK